WIREMWSVDDPTDPILIAGKPTIIKATVHNNEPVLVNNIKVNFYNGNPVAGGTLIGSDTIPAITANDYDIASIQWTVTSNVKSVYVVVDPANSIQETNEVNNIAYKLIDEKMIDSDGDGLSDYDEKHGIRTNYGVYLTESDNSDSDGDGISDGVEIGNDKRWSLSIGGYYFEIKSNPNSVDSDWDGLNDSDEYKYGSNPLNPHSDSDNVNDGDEIKIGTNPMNGDTDGDGTPDGVHYVGDIKLTLGEFGTLLGDGGIEEKVINDIISKIGNDNPTWPPKELVVIRTPLGFFPKGFPVLWTVDSEKTISESKLEIGLKGGFITGDGGEYFSPQTYEMNVLLDGVVPITGGTIKMQPYADIDSFRLAGEDAETVVIVKEDRRFDPSKIPEEVQVIAVAGAVVVLAKGFVILATSEISIPIILVIIAAGGASKAVRDSFRDLSGIEVWEIEDSV
ncbi:MAG: hypothetical protein KAH86_04860, partial [Methanosarcinales archaeon]|nr:hypothetical protein [Methanosarcinales archaeon]